MDEHENGSQETQTNRSEQEKTERQVQFTNYPELLLSKSRLQEYTQRSSLPIPIYQTVNEGAQHAPRFRSTVLVDGSYYASPNTFAHLKTAEQDAARVALDGISQKIKDEGRHFICQDTIFCKSILNEYAVKMNMEIPAYTTIRQEGRFPVFVSSLVFNGVEYTGNAGKNKKEAEQLAARAVILSILGDSSFGTVISEIVKAKSKLCAALRGVNVSHSTHDGVLPQVVVSDTFSGQLNSIQGTHPPLHEYKKPKPNPTSEPIAPPIVFVPSVSQPPLVVGSTSASKRNRNKKKGKKKARVKTEFPVAVVPLSQLPPCSVAQ